MKCYIPPKKIRNKSIYFRKKSDFGNLYNVVINCLKNNKTEIEDKIKSPSRKTSFDDSSSSIKSFNGFIYKINQQIAEYNKKIYNKHKPFKGTKNLFWEYNALGYDEYLII